eukprot:1357186-Amorphochlora_amoeboformis.AAC.3
MKSAILPKFAMFSAVSNSSSRAKPDRPAMGFKCNRCFVTVPKIGYITLCGHFFCHRCRPNCEGEGPCFAHSLDGNNVVPIVRQIGRHLAILLRTKAGRKRCCEALGTQTI